MEIIVVFVGLYVSIVCGLLSSYLASQKGHSTGAWFAAGFFLSILGLIAAAGLPLKPIEPSGSGTKRCPECAEHINMQALICRYCGHRFDKQEIISELGHIMESDSSERIHAIETLAETRDEAAVPHLEKALPFANIETQYVISKALINIGTVPALLSVLEAGGIDLRDKAARLLREKADLSITPRLVKILERGGHYGTISAVVSVLEKIRDEDSIRALINALSRGYSRDRISAALVKIGDQAIPYLEEEVRQSGKNRKYAEKVIAKIKASGSMT